jgi:phosphatidylethanolamine/phosphatidyl-N-methylethanolamine N-methyltransferase
MTMSEVVELLRCVECEFPVALSAEQITCTKCGARWATVNGVFDLRPRASVPLPRMYGDPHYREWNRRLAQAQDYFYQSNPVISWVQNAGHRAIRAMAADRPEALTLDMACGDGGHRPYMHRPDRVVGVDIDQGSLESYRRRHPDSLTVRGDCYRLPFRDATFDRVLNIYNLEHLVHLDFALEEARRVLKDDGTFMVSVPTEGGLAWVMGRQLTTARQFGRDGLDYRRANAIDHCNCIWQIEKAIHRHFRVTGRRLFPLPVPTYHGNLIVTWSLRK